MKDPPKEEVVRWCILRPVASVVGWGLSALHIAVAALGLLRFFLLTGASVPYTLQRKRWYEREMLGRPMTPREYVAFGLWVAASGRRGR